MSPAPSFTSCTHTALRVNGVRTACARRARGLCPDACAPHACAGARVPCHPQQAHTREARGAAHRGAAAAARGARRAGGGDADGLLSGDGAAALRVRLRALRHELPRLLPRAGAYSALLCSALLCSTLLCSALLTLLTSPPTATPPPPTATPPPPRREVSRRRTPHLLTYLHLLTYSAGTLLC